METNRNIVSNFEANRKRAVAFAESGVWCKPIVVSEQDADDTIVCQKGSGDPSHYRRFRIEVEMRPETQAKSLQLASENDESDLAEYLREKWVMDVTCSATDVIEVDFPFVD